MGFALLLASAMLPADDFTEFGENLAQFGVAAQSSQLGGFGPENALDGDFGNFTHTQANADLPGPAWWEVDLLDEFEIGLIAICNRTSCCGSRLRDIVVEIRDEFGDIVWATTDVDDPDPDELLNPENELGAFPLGPPSIIVDVEGLNGGNPVSGQIIRVNRLPDEDLSGSGGAGNNDEGTVLQIGEFGAFAESGCEAEGDSHCTGIDAAGPDDGNLIGEWTFTVSGDDESGDPLTYRVSAEHEGGTVVSGTSDVGEIALDLQLPGTWTVSASVDDSPVCSDEAADAGCEPITVEVQLGIEPVDIESCEFTEEGDVLLSWTNPEGGGEIIITANDEEVASVGREVESTTIAGEDLPPGDPLQLCVDNGAVNPSCCTVTANIALGKPAAQSSQLGGYDPGRAVDGNLGNFHHTNNSQPGPAVWEVDLEDEFDIMRIVVHNRGDGCCQSRLRDIVVSIHEGSFLEDFIDPDINDNAEEWVPDTIWEEHSTNLIWQTEDVLNPENFDGSPSMIEIDLTGQGDGIGVIGQYVRVTRISDADQSGGAGNADEPKVLQMGELQVFGRRPGAVQPGPKSRPGDVNGDGVFNLSDAVAHLGFLFGGIERPQCSSFAMLDFNGDGVNNLTDAVAALTRLFSGGPPHVLGADCTEVEGCEANCL